MVDSPYSSRWNRFWHEPLRAERLALMRILLGVALLAQQFVEFVPNMEEFFGPTGYAPAGLLDQTQLDDWNWTMLIFNADDPAVVYPVFGLWVACTLAFTVGFWTRLMNVAVWLLTMSFLARNFFLLDGGDDTLQICVFLLLLSPSGRALSVDAWLRRRRGGDAGPVYTPAWPVRVIQIQLCVIYCTSGWIKLAGTDWFVGTWWDVLRITLATRSIDTIGQVPEPVRVSLLVNGAVVAPVRQPQGDLYAPSRRGEYAESRWRLTSLRGPPISGVVPGEAAVVSPDGHWVAFVNRLDLYLAPMAVARASRAPSRSDRGIRRITHRGGLYPRWLDNDRLEFQSGDRYYQWHRATGRLDSVRFAASLPRPPVGGSVALTGARVLTPRRRSRPPPPRFASDLAPPRRICPLPRLRGHHRHRSRLGVRPRLPHRRADRGRRDRGAADLSIR